MSAAAPPRRRRENRLQMGLQQPLIPSRDHESGS
eukprot:CAMPEP_0198238574 /NCGR_PEP_ID=MMETSP1446-20131203/4194_1 /TAXON_ID=1461542 ORGANISM="Unidentified sp, Strain CCMP2111" /NCGR_SAMPLE_ID=MMETSP1446 /ASSEMBLY_ACC=CAM_ASM_001112 /LENGTH=33 /DNA_ID= /DNA_START= /DNA_END= /DNA_ORIENTATION=